MTITENPERKTISEAVLDLKKSFPVSELEGQLKRLFLRYLDKNKPVIVNRAKAAEIMQNRNSPPQNHEKELVDQRQDPSLQKYMKKKMMSFRGSSPGMSAFKRMSNLHRKREKKKSRFNSKDSPRGESGLKFHFVRQKSEKEKSSNRAFLN